MAALCLSAALAATSCGTSRDAHLSTGAGADGTTAATTPTDPAREAVGDESGEVRGTFSTEEAASQRRKKIDHLVRNPYLAGDDLSPEERDRNTDALSVIYAVRVDDADGRQVGWFTTEFVELDEYPAQLDAAKRVIAEAKPPS
jgi:hypothetical protein